jgi:hypothetical protein
MMQTCKLTTVIFLLLATLSFPLFAQTPPKEGTATVSGVVTLKGEPGRHRGHHRRWTQEKYY